MHGLWKRGKQLLADENAAEVTELGIVLGLIVAGAVALIATIGPKIRQFYQDTEDAFPD